MKDNFSRQSSLYHQFRPSYPDELLHFILSHIKEKNLAWDCGTGNGQMAGKLAGYFKKVYATDISQKQLSNAEKKPTIEYRIENAEHSSFKNNFFDLVTVAQAVHWFNFEKFYAEAIRTSKHNGIIALVGYSLIKTNNTCDKVINKLYWNILGKYWDNERRYIDEEYKTIPFPFKEITVPEMCISYHQTFDQLIGYLNTWSAVQHFIKQNSTNPIEIIYEELKTAWENNKVQTIRFPLISRIGKIEK